MKIECPESTYVHRRIPKESFYQNMTFTTGQKSKFVSDIDRIFVEYSFTTDNLRLQKRGKIREILVVSIELKTKNYNPKLLEAIAKQNAHKLIFLLKYEKEEQAAVYYTKLYTTEWRPQDTGEIVITGFSLDDVWEHSIEQIALPEDGDAREDSLIDRLRRKDKIEKLIKEIEKLEAAAWKEPQPKKKYNIYTRIQNKKDKLKELNNG